MKLIPTLLFAILLTSGSVDAQICYPSSASDLELDLMIQENLYKKDIHDAESGDYMLTGWRTQRSTFWGGYVQNKTDLYFRVNNNLNILCTIRPVRHKDSYGDSPTDSVDVSFGVESYGEMNPQYTGRYGKKRLKIDGDNTYYEAVYIGEYAIVIKDFVYLKYIFRNKENLCNIGDYEFKYETLSQN